MQKPFFRDLGGAGCLEIEKGHCDMQKYCFAVSFVRSPYSIVDIEQKYTPHIDYILQNPLKNQ